MATEKKTTMLDLASNNPWSAVTVQNPQTTIEVKEPEPEEEPEEVVAEVSETTPEPEIEEIEEEGGEETPGESVEIEEGVEPEEEPVDINEYYYLGSKLKNDGFLPEEFEVTEDVSGTEVWSAYEKKLKALSEPRIRQEVYTKLEQEGVNENDLLIARALRQGIDVSLLNKATMHERYAAYTEDSEESQKVDSIKAMYRARGFKEKEIDNQVKIAEENDSLEDLFSESKIFHTTEWKNFKEGEKQRVVQEETAVREQMENAEKLVRKILSNKEVGGEQFSDEEAKLLREAIYTPNEILEWEGQKYNVTKLYKFNWMLEHDPELKLWALKKYLLKDKDLDSLKTEIKKELDDDFLKSYKTSVRKDILSRKKKQVKKKLETQVQNSEPESKKNTFYIELGQ